MKVFLLSLIFCFSTYALGSSYPSWVYVAFDHWAVQWEKKYNTPSEKEFRVGVFYSNIKLIEETNAAQSSYKLGPNAFTDLTVDEFLQLYASPVVNEPSEGQIEDTIVGELADYPDSVDWVASGAVTDVKTQGTCVNGWAYSAAGALEGLSAIANKQLVSLSTSQLVDCSSSYGNQGCKAGVPLLALKYTKDYGLESLESYKEKGSASCLYDSSKVVIKNTGLVQVQKKSESAFLSALATNPLSVGIDAEKIMSYSSGVFNDPNCGTRVDHDILAVAYSLTNGTITAKNSWGVSWGEAGYIRFPLLGDGRGECGLYLTAVYPTL